MARNTAAFMKPVQPDAVLGAIVGMEPLPRPTIVKLLWDHIRAHGLQDATNRRQINAGATLRPLFDGQPSVSMFELPKCVSRHLVAIG